MCTFSMLLPVKTVFSASRILYSYCPHSLHALEATLMNALLSTILNIYAIFIQWGTPAILNTESNMKTALEICTPNKHFKWKMPLPKMTTQNICGSHHSLYQKCLFGINFREVLKLLYIYRSWYFLKTVFILYCSCVYIYTVTGRACMCMAHTGRSEERLWRNFSPSTFTWAPEFKFRSLACAASTFSAESTLWPNLMGQRGFFEKYFFLKSTDPSLTTSLLILNT